MFSFYTENGSALCQKRIIADSNYDKAIVVAKISESLLYHHPSRTSTPYFLSLTISFIGSPFGSFDGTTFFRARRTKCRSVVVLMGGRPLVLIADLITT